MGVSNAILTVEDSTSKTWNAIAHTNRTPLVILAVLAINIGVIAKPFVQNRFNKCAVFVCESNALSFRIMVGFFCQ